MARLKDICCPRCTFQPDSKEQWLCSCGCLWNTFETFGKCPDCCRQWERTQCPSCNKWSAHVDWYKGIADALNREMVVLKCKPVKPSNLENKKRKNFNNGGISGPAG